MSDTVRYDNLVYTTLKSALTAGATTINANTASSPFSSPASAPTGELRALYIVDDPAAPAAVEIVHYTTVASDGGGGLNITGTIRNAEPGSGGPAGSGNPQAFSAGAAVYSAPTAACMGQTKKAFSAIGAEPVYLFGQSFQLADAASKSLTKGTDICLNSPQTVFLIGSQGSGTTTWGGLFGCWKGLSCSTISCGSGFTFGTTSEPAGSLDVAIWTPDSSTITIKNRRGFTCRITLFEFAPSD